MDYKEQELGSMNRNGRIVWLVGSFLLFALSDSLGAQGFVMIGGFLALMTFLVLGGGIGYLLAEHNIRKEAKNQQRKTATHSQPLLVKQKTG
ncbi:MAG: hypothetical protein LVQ95_02425 [Candidatus Micrarchaeales archaeon]|nr:hypothetical protein [Candidatus Micrarchaeales archaeon]